MDYNNLKNAIKGSNLTIRECASKVGMSETGFHQSIQRGTMTISVYEKDNLIHIDVSDNGLGMPEKVVEYIMHNRVISSKRGSGIGVRNVDERSKLIFGVLYGVTIDSDLDEGTSGSIIIPKLEETAEINSDESNKTKL